MYEGLRNLLHLKGQGMAEDMSGFQRQFDLKSLIPIMAKQAMPQQQQAMPTPPMPSPPSFQYGGEVKMEEGGMLTGGDFVIDAHTVAAIGNGSSQAGGEVLDDMMPNVGNPDESFRGLVTAETGDGMSDNVSYEVEGDEQINQALISKDEYIVDRDQVVALGDGDEDAGTARLEALREKIRQLKFGTKKQPEEINSTEVIQTVLEGTE
jgi:hypothetical protein